MDANDTMTNQSMIAELVARRTGFHEVKNYRTEWTFEDIAMLKKLFEGGCGISEIAVRLQRSEIAVFNRLHIDGLFREINKKNPDKQNTDKCKCGKCELRFQCPMNPQFCKNCA